MWSIDGDDVQKTNLRESDVGAAAIAVKLV
jgi:hypothetical protein